MEIKSKDTIPTGAYDRIVVEIKANSMHNYRRDNTPSMTEAKYLKIKISNTLHEITNLKNTIDNNRKTIDKLISESNEIKLTPDYQQINNLINQINTSDNSNKYLKIFANSDHKLYDKFKNNKIQIDVLNKEIEESVEELYLNQKTLELDQKKLPQLELDDYVFNSHDSRLEAIERIYKKNKDLDELKRLVHYACELLDKYLFGNDYVAPYKDNLLSWDTAPKRFKEVMMDDYIQIYKDKERAVKEIKKKINKMNENAVYDWYNDDW